MYRQAYAIEMRTLLSGGVKKGCVSKPGRMHSPWSVVRVEEWENGFKLSMHFKQTERGTIWIHSLISSSTPHAACFPSVPSRVLRRIRTSSAVLRAFRYPRSSLRSPQRSHRCPRSCSVGAPR